MVWKNVTLSLHVRRIGLKVGLCVAQPHLNPVDVVQVLASNEQPLRVVTQIAQSEAVLKLGDLVSDQVGWSGIYLLLLLRISFRIILRGFMLALILGPDLLLCVTRWMGLPGVLRVARLVALLQACARLIDQSRVVPLAL